MEENAPIVKAHSSKYNIIDFRGMGADSLLRQGRTTWPADSTHPERPADEQIPLYVRYVDLFGDDVSGAVSKQ